MRLRLGTFSRYRPRVLTLVVLFLVGALIALANLSNEISRRCVDALTSSANLRFDLRESDAGDQVGLNLLNASYGWPLLWRQSVRAPYMGPSMVVGVCYSGARLAGNVTLWLLMLAVLAGTCEWLIRHYRPRFCWSLRTMLAAVAMLAACCGGFAAARNRAKAQDPLFDIAPWDTKSVFVERWGPRWLDAIGADRYCRRIVGVTLDKGIGGIGTQQAKTNRDYLLRLKRLPDLQYLFCEMDRALPETLAELRQLRVLRVRGINWEYDRRKSEELLSTIGHMGQLEHLRLEWMEVDGNSLSALAGLSNLKSLSLDQVSIEGREWDSDPPLLSYVPPLPRLEAIDLNVNIGDRDLPYLAAFPSLRSLNLPLSDVTSAGLPALASLRSLDKLALYDDALSVSGMEALVTVQRLKELHLNLSHGPLSPATHLVLDDGSELDVRETVLDQFRRTMESLRQSHPGIVIDGNDDELDWDEDKKVMSQYLRRGMGPDPRLGFWGCWQWRKERN